MSKIDAPGTASRSVPTRHGREERLGIFLIFGAAVAWSIGGAIERQLATADSWTIVFWRSTWAALFLFGFMFWRDGVRGTVGLFRNMGLPGIAVAVCFSIGSTCFVIALAYTTVANVLLLQASTPLVAALLAWLVFREPASGATWVAVWAVIVGIAIMVSETLDSRISPIGDGLALLIAIVFSTATVITRRYSHVRMSPAVCLGTMIAVCVSGSLASGYVVTGADMAWLFAFGALNLGLGLALFVTGARLVPAAIATLIATFETLLGPIWVWLFHDEVPSARTMFGGAIILMALIGHIGWQWLGQRTAPATG